MDQTIKDYFKALGRKGGKARALSLTAEKRKTIAKQGQKALQKKVKESLNKA